MVFAMPVLAPPEWLARQFLLAQTRGHLKWVVACLRGELDLGGQKEVALDKLPQLSMPTLLIWGVNDLVVPSYHASAAAARLQKGRVVTIPGAGHLPHVEQPKILLTALGEFLAGETANS